ncbi:MAG: hypothetical protein E7254_00265 [Lachnospiraceae bacterium]|nr:hypothetical protein [Lachnospiraceae bacterium]
MKKLRQELIKEMCKLKEFISIAENQLANCPCEGKRLKVEVKHNSVQFYVKDDGEDSRYRYMTRFEKESAHNIIKHDYYSKAIKYAKKQMILMEQLIDNIDHASLDSLFQKLGKGRQQIIDTILISDSAQTLKDLKDSVLISNEQYVKIWQSEIYEGKSFSEYDAKIYTEKGERVRSKSEKIIADKLLREGIPYKYEHPIYITQFGNIYPDFTLLDVRNRRNIILEHFGLMDDEKYAVNAIKKIQLYLNEGYIFGETLFITMESSETPFDSRMLEGLINLLKY